MISSSIQNNILTIQVTEELTIDLFPDFQHSYQDQEFERVEVCFANATHIDSGGLGMLLQLRTHVGTDAPKIELINVPTTINKVFQVVNFDKIFTIK